MPIASLRLTALKTLQEFLKNNFHQTTVKKFICSFNYSLGRAVLHPILGEKSWLITKFKVVGIAKQRDLRQKCFTKFY